MIKLAFIILKKDLKLIFRSGTVIAQSILLGLVLIFLFSFAQEESAFSPMSSAALFWLCSLFCQILIFNQLYGFEEKNSARIYLNLYANPIQGVWLGKMLTALILLALSQLCYYPAILIFMRQIPDDYAIVSCLAVLICDLGICSLGALLGSINQGSITKDALLSVFLFPLLTPLLLSGTIIGACAFGGEIRNYAEWLKLALAFDAIYIACSLLLFGFLYQDKA